MGFKGVFFIVLSIIMSPLWGSNECLSLFCYKNVTPTGFKQRSIPNLLVSLSRINFLGSYPFNFLILENMEVQE